MKGMLKMIKYHKISSTILLSSIILTVISFIIGFVFDRSFLTFAGSMFIGGIALYGYRKDKELDSIEKEKERWNIRRFLAIEIGSTTSNLEKFTGKKISQEEIEIGGNLRVWYKLSNQITEIFEEDEVKLLNEFFRKLRNIEDLPNYKNNKPFSSKEKNMIANSLVLGTQILKNVFKEDKIKLEESKISMIEVDEIINLKDFKKFEQKVLELNKQGKLEDFFEKINYPYFKNPEITCPYLMEVLSKNKNILHISDSQIASFLSKLISKEEYSRRNILKKCVLKDENLIISVRLLNNIAYKFDEIENILLKKIYIWNKSEKLLSCSQLYDILDYWSFIENKETVEEFIKNTLKDKNKTIQLIKGFKKGNNPPSFEIEIMNRLISLEYFKEELNKTKYPEKYKELIEDFKEELERYIKKK